MATPKFAPNSIFRYPKIDCRQMCMKLLGSLDDEDAEPMIAKDGNIYRRRKKPSIHVVREFCWFYILWFMERNNVAAFKKPLSREIARLTGFGVQTIRKALVALQCDGSIRKENSKTYIVRKELANRCSGLFPTAMSRELKTPNWSAKQRALFEHMTQAVRKFEKAEDDEMQMMQETVNELVAENRDLREQLMRVSLDYAEMRGARNELKGVYDADADRTINTYERAFDKARGVVDALHMEDEDDSPGVKHEIKLVPNPPRNPSKYDAKH